MTEITKTDQEEEDSESYKRTPKTSIDVPFSNESTEKNESQSAGNTTTSKREPAETVSPAVQEIGVQTEENVNDERSRMVAGSRTTSSNDKDRNNVDLTAITPAQNTAALATNVNESSQQNSTSGGYLPTNVDGDVIESSNEDILFEEFTESGDEAFLDDEWNATQDGVMNQSMVAIPGIEPDMKKREAKEKRNTQEEKVIEMQNLSSRDIDEDLKQVAFDEKYGIDEDDDDDLEKRRANLKQFHEMGTVMTWAKMNQIDVENEAQVEMHTYITLGMVCCVGIIAYLIGWGVIGSDLDNADDTYIVGFQITGTIMIMLSIYLICMGRWIFFQIAFSLTPLTCWSIVIPIGIIISRAKKNQSLHGDDSDEEEITSAIFMTERSPSAKERERQENLSLYEQYREFVTRYHEFLFACVIAICSFFNYVYACDFVVRVCFADKTRGDITNAAAGLIGTFFLLWTVLVNYLNIRDMPILSSIEV